jgi:hypothetical protein
MQRGKSTEKIYVCIAFESIMKLTIEQALQRAVQDHKGAGQAGTHVLRGCAPIASSTLMPHAIIY